MTVAAKIKLNLILAVVNPNHWSSIGTSCNTVSMKIHI